MNQSLLDKIRAEHIDPFSADLIARRKEVLDRVRNSNPKGQKVEYLGKEFVVFPSVFWPYDDSMPLVQNYHVNPGESVLDVCTGSGVIAIQSAYRGAGRVVALDINPQAVKAAMINAYLHGFSSKIDVLQSDVFSDIDSNRMFDVITMNPPFTRGDRIDLTATGVYDPCLHVHREFFNGFDAHLKSGGRSYIAQSNFGNAEDMLKMADEAGLTTRLIGERQMPSGDPRKFYAFEMRRK